MMAVCSYRYKDLLNAIVSVRTYTKTHTESNNGCSYRYTDQLNSLAALGSNPNQLNQFGQAPLCIAAHRSVTTYKKTKVFCGAAIERIRKTKVKGIL